MVSFEEAIERADLALAAGADIAFVEAAQSMEEVAAIPRLVKGPCLLNIVPGGKTPIFHLDEAQAMGYRMAILPGILLKNVIERCDEVLLALQQSRMPVAAASNVSVANAFRRFGADEWNALRTRFQSTDTQAVPAPAKE